MAECRGCYRTIYSFYGDRTEDEKCVACLGIQDEVDYRITKGKKPPRWEQAFQRQRLQDWRMKARAVIRYPLFRLVLVTR